MNTGHHEVKSSLLYQKETMQAVIEASKISNPRELRRFKSCLGVACQTAECLKSVTDPVVRYTMFVQLIKILSQSMICLGKEENAENLEEDQQRLAEVLEVRQQTSGDGQERKLSDQARDLERCIAAREGINDQLEQLQQVFGEYLNGLCRWIEMPIYSPDHPGGQLQMRRAEEEFQHLGDQNRQKSGVSSKLDVIKE
jgi:hypothetical protein